MLKCILLQTMGTEYSMCPKQIPLGFCGPNLLTQKRAYLLSVPVYFISPALSCSSQPLLGISASGVIEWSTHTWWRHLAGLSRGCLLHICTSHCSGLALSESETPAGTHSSTFLSIKVGCVCSLKSESKSFWAVESWTAEICRFPCFMLLTREGLAVNSHFMHSYPLL